MIASPKRCHKSPSKLKVKSSFTQEQSFCEDHLPDFYTQCLSIFGKHYSEQCILKPTPSSGCCAAPGKFLCLLQGQVSLHSPCYTFRFPHSLFSQCLMDENSPITQLSTSALHNSVCVISITFCAAGNSYCHREYNTEYAKLLQQNSGCPGFK